MNNRNCYDKIWESNHQRIYGGGAFLFALVALLFLCFSCAKQTRIEYVDREVVKYETKYQHDTLINNIHDSIYHTVFQKGDTIFDTKYVEHIRYKDRIVNTSDTVYRDSIQTEIEYTETEKEVTPKWCYYCLGISIILFIFALIFLRNKIKKWLTR